MIIVTIEEQIDIREMRSLFTYLESRDELAGHLELRSTHESDHLGGVADAIAVAVGAGGTITVLAAAIASWIERRGRSVRIRLANDQTGRSVEFRGVHMAEASVTEVQAMLRDMTRVLAESPPEKPIAS